MELLPCILIHASLDTAHKYSWHDDVASRSGMVYAAYLPRSNGSSASCLWRSSSTAIQALLTAALICAQASCKHKQLMHASSGVQELLDCSGLNLTQTARLQMPCLLVGFTLRKQRLCSRKCCAHCCCAKPVPADICMFLSSTNEQTMIPSNGQGVFMHSYIFRNTNLLGATGTSNCSLSEPAPYMPN